jgi:hypothetical protein
MLEIFRLSERLIIITARSRCDASISQTDGQSITNIFSDNIFYSPKHACFLLYFMPVPDDALMRKPKHIARFRQ